MRDEKPSVGDRPRPRRRDIDVIRDGVAPIDLREEGDRAIWSALGRSALQWINKGRSYPDWAAEVLDPRSNLGHQLRVTGKGKVRTTKAVHRMLQSAWARAEERAVKQPAWTSEEARAEAERRAGLLRGVVADAEAPLTDAQRAVLVHVAALAETVGSVVVNLPRRSVQEVTELGERSTRTALTKLEDAGLLVMVERGRPSGARTARPMANAYRLPDDQAISSFLSRGTRQVGPLALAGGTPADANAGTRPYGGPTCQVADATPASTSGNVVALASPAVTTSPMVRRGVMDPTAVLTSMNLTPDELRELALVALTLAQEPPEGRVRAGAR